MPRRIDISTHESRRVLRRMEETFDSIISLYSMLQRAPSDLAPGWKGDTRETFNKRIATLEESARSFKTGFTTEQEHALEIFRKIEEATEGYTNGKR